MDTSNTRINTFDYLSINEMQCQYCDKLISNKSNLVRHQRTNKVCLFAQGKIESTKRSIPRKEVPVPCKSCGKEFARKSWLREHLKTCYALERETRDKEAHLQEVQGLKSDIEDLKNQLNTHLQELRQKLTQEYMRGRLDATKEINDNLVGLDIAKSRVKALEKKYLRKQKRAIYTDNYVVYLITNEDLLKKRTYIIGSATSLQNRLSTYNKSAEHTVSYFSKCHNKEKMKLLETMVLSKLADYREVANRDRFVIPDGKDKDFFIEVYKQGEVFLGL